MVLYKTDFNWSKAWWYGSVSGLFAVPLLSPILLKTHNDIQGYRKRFMTYVLQNWYPARINYWITVFLVTDHVFQYIKSDIKKIK